MSDLTVRPQASFVDFLQLGENYLAHRKILGEMVSLREQNLAGTQLMIDRMDGIQRVGIMGIELSARNADIEQSLLSESNVLKEEMIQAQEESLQVQKESLQAQEESLQVQEESLQVQKESLQVALESLQAQSQSLQSLREIEYCLENLSRQTNQIMSNTGAIVNHLDRQVKKQEGEEARRLLIHNLKVQLGLTESRKNQYPEWSLLEINILEEMVSSTDLSIEQFASSLEELGHAQAIFDDMKALKAEITGLLGD